MITLDFETEAITVNPLWRPPRPVGLAIYGPPNDPFYLTDWEEIKATWLAFINSEIPLLFHNAQFDLAVGLKWLGGKEPHWERVHDTLFLLFLKDPYSTSLSLKPSADKYLDLPPQEQDALHRWILEHIPDATPSTAGAYISHAPVDLVAPYAKGDVYRTRLLYDKFIGELGGEAYDRERRLAPKLRASSSIGIRVDRERLERDYEFCKGSLATADTRIYERLKCEPFNINSPNELAERMDKAGSVSEWILTPTGRRSTSKDNLQKVCNDPELTQLLVYRNTMKTCTGTFMLPWINFSAEDGRVHTEWNQVANDEGLHAGTRTGRLSSSRPNFQNAPNIFKGMDRRGNNLYTNAPIPTELREYTPFDSDILEGLAPLPNMRSYLLPEVGHIWIKRDFSSQEIRILAHFEDGTLLEAYINDPWLDPHAMAQQLIETMMGLRYERKDVKITGFSIIYGSGIGGLASQLNRPPHEAHDLREAYMQAMPAAKALAKSTRNRGRSGQAIKTWGGRLYYTEPPKIVGGALRSYEYKLLNYLIQGSAGDQTKQVINDWWEQYKGVDTVFLVTIHDEINASVPAEYWMQEMRQLRLAMDQPLFDCPMRSEGEHGPNWGSLTKLTREKDYDTVVQQHGNLRAMSSEV